MRNCVAVGHLKPRVVLLIESSTVTDMAEEDVLALKQEVLKRTAQFNSRLLVHERIEDPSVILVAPAGSLPRTSVSSVDEHSEMGTC